MFSSVKFNIINIMDRHKHSELCKSPNPFETCKRTKTVKSETSEKAFRTLSISLLKKGSRPCTCQYPWLITLLCHLSHGTCQLCRTRPETTIWWPQSVSVLKRFYHTCAFLEFSHMKSLYVFCWTFLLWSSDCCGVSKIYIALNVRLKNAFIHSKVHWIKHHSNWHTSKLDLGLKNCCPYPSSPDPHFHPLTSCNP